MICAFAPLTALAGATDQPDALPALIPWPAHLERQSGCFSITETTQVFVEAGNTEIRAVGECLAESMHRSTGRPMTVRKFNSAKPVRDAIVLTTVGADPSLGEESYELKVSPTSMLLRARQPRGLFLGIQTLRQLLPPEVETVSAERSERVTPLTIPCVRITDRPRYEWRGMLLDCGRHFMTKEFVKRYIDLLAYHKMNVLHWHLTEDQGWRIEIKKYPKLTEVGAWRTATRNSEQPATSGRYGGYYTQDDVKEIVEYARSRYITVVPEIEMPGHSLAALASYPELGCAGQPYEVGTRWGVYDDVYCAGNDRVFEFLQDVLTEVLGLFPSEYIHIGGDECPKTQWSHCPKCQARIKAEGLEEEHELQSYFIRRIEKFLNSKGRRLIGWDEILEGGLAPNATVQSWRGMEGAIAAARAGHDVVASPTSHCYLDYSYDAISLQRIYSFDPTPAELTPDQARHILGAEGNIWTERAPQKLVDRQVFPRLCALAEVTWSPAASRDWENFAERMKTHYRRLDTLGVTYFLQPPQYASRDRVFEDAAEMVLDNPLGRGVVRYTLDDRDPAPDSPRYVEPVRLTDTTVVKAQTFLADGRTTGIAEFHFRKLRPREAVEVSNAVPGLAYAYYEGSWQRLPDFEKLSPTAMGTATTFDLDVRKRDDGFALRFTGYLQVPANGVYTFYLVSDDGSRLWIGSDLVVDHDGLHSACEASGQIILKAGKHPIAVAHFEAGGSQRLEVSYAGPGNAEHPIPGSVLWRVPTD